MKAKKKYYRRPLITLGKEGTDLTWQQPFPEETKCNHCNGMARLGLVYFERVGQKEYVKNLYPNAPKGEGYWLHDACAIAIYLCKKCLKPTALCNQA